MSSLSPMVACILLVLTASANPRLGWVITFKCHLLYIQIVPFRLNIISCSKNPCGSSTYFFGTISRMEDISKRIKMSLMVVPSFSTTLLSF